MLGVPIFSNSSIILPGLWELHALTLAAYVVMISDTGVQADTERVQAGSAQEGVGPAGASEGEEEEGPGTARK